MSRSLRLMMLFGCLMMSPAYAAFEWVPPSPQEQAQAPAAMPAPQATMPAPPPAPAYQAALLPMPEKMELAPAPQVLMPASPPAPAYQPAMLPMPEKMELAPAPRDLTPVPTAMPAPMQQNPDMIEGFGRDVPLTIATQQIVPPSHMVQYGQDVDPSTVVTWQGGKTWQEALGESLAPIALKATIVGDTVLIERTSPPAIVAAPAPDLIAAAPLPVPAEVASIKPPVPEVWVAPRASTLRQVLTEWCRLANVQLQWSAQYDYPIMSDAQISGTFEQAVEKLLFGLSEAQPRPLARLHPNEPAGPAILVVQTRYILE